MSTSKKTPAKKRVEFRLIAPSNPRHKRPCAGCTACCAVFAVAEVAAPAWVPCRFLSDSGCGTYSTRPAICRDFLCEYALGNAPGWMKPDACGVIPVHTAGNTAMHLREVWPDASDADPIRQFIRQSNLRGIHVLVTLHPRELTADTADGEPEIARNRLYLASGEVREFAGDDYTTTLIAPKV